MALWQPGRHSTKGLSTILRLRGPQPPSLRRKKKDSFVSNTHQTEFPPTRAFRKREGSRGVKERRGRLARRQNAPLALHLSLPPFVLASSPFHSTVSPHLWAQPQRSGTPCCWHTSPSAHCCASHLGCGSTRREGGGKELFPRQTAGETTRNPLVCLPACCDRCGRPQAVHASSRVVAAKVSRVWTLTRQGVTHR